jgi:hypothetical protein
VQATRRAYIGLMKLVKYVPVDSAVYTNAKEFSIVHGIPLTALVTEAVLYWLETVGGAVTEEVIARVTEASKYIS